MNNFKQKSVNLQFSDIVNLCFTLVIQINVYCRKSGNFTVDKFLANLRVPPFAIFFPKNYSTIKKNRRLVSTCILYYMNRCLYM